MGHGPWQVPIKGPVSVAADAHEVSCVGVAAASRGMQYVLRLAARGIFMVIGGDRHAATTDKYSCVAPEPDLLGGGMIAFAAEIRDGAQ